MADQINGAANNAHKDAHDSQENSETKQHSSEIVEGSEGVTQEDLDTYRHVADRLPISAWLVVFVEFAERWSYYGTTNLYSNYIRAPLPLDSKDGRVIHDRKNGIAGALGQGQQKAFTISELWSVQEFPCPTLSVPRNVQHLLPVYYTMDWCYPG